MSNISFNSITKLAEECETLNQQIYEHERKLEDLIENYNDKRAELDAKLTYINSLKKLCSQHDKELKQYQYQLREVNSNLIDMSDEADQIELLFLKLADSLRRLLFQIRDKL